MSTIRKQKLTAKHKLRHDINEAARAPEQHLMVCENLKNHSQALLSKARMDQITAVMEWFEEFFIEKLDEPTKWLQDGLINTLSLNLEHKVKLITYTKNVILLLRGLYEPATLCSFGTTRAVLYLTLFIDLAIDSCGRVGEIIPTDSKRQGECLHWDDVIFYLHRVVRGFLRFSANVTFKWLKGMRTKPGLEFNSVCYMLSLYGLDVQARLTG
ncbi:MAG: hypothetical protein M1830_007093 [Pleopsidium flavum]|nr:MAG: hypothetical protein M1830_007093 [Pleopsidium flavum]